MVETGNCASKHNRKDDTMTDTETSSSDNDYNSEDPEDYFGFGKGQFLVSQPFLYLKLSLAPAAKRVKLHSDACNDSDDDTGENRKDGNTTTPTDNSGADNNPPESTSPKKSDANPGCGWDSPSNNWPKVEKDDLPWCRTQSIVDIGKINGTNFTMYPSNSQTKYLFRKS